MPSGSAGMMGGRKPSQPSTHHPESRHPMERPALLLALALALPGLPALAEGGAQLPPVDHAATIKECGACHLVFPPQMLPTRSWQKLMGDLKAHFGQDASIAD